MQSSIENRTSHKMIVSGIIFSLLGVSLGLATPEEAFLGKMIGIVLIHGSLTFTAMVLFSFGGVFGVLYLFGKKDFYILWAIAILKMAIVVWAVSLVVGVITAYLTWGGLLLIEPKLVSGVLLFAVSLIALLTMDQISHNNQSVILIILSILPWIIRFGVGNLLHPENPTSGTHLEIFFISIAVFFILASMSGVVLFKTLSEEIQ
jgi:hypothetical protein